ncbi:glycosyltransferase [Vreelandella populi]|uniref:Glycosyltransferase family 2 protein n=1 Tax=Vreelandella populi TaxID=2498858 RepID=A0A3S0WJ49_9GAMM|nr:glycosyltransferase family 2 protein [Halomonas populi]RUR42372.1 glycosyltransferase family 2 protein [Halomonas populi]RUR46023.1 glycosyltransferase family 2 protein [Halomonas populi]
MNSVGLCVPTLNAGAFWHEWIARATPAATGFRVLILDSSSDDETVAIAQQAGFEILHISRQEFNHGGTRQLALHYLSDCDIVLFLTQDALVATPDSLAELISVFEDPVVGAAFGRQLPHQDATAIATHARLFNYPSTSRVVSQADIPRLGIKTAFLSNSFAAYRRQALIDAGGFPDNVILSEDMMAGARLLEHGWKLAYNAEACVYHSHNYSIRAEFKRYFDIGVFHAQEAWLTKWMGSAEGEGMRFIRSEASYLLRHAPLTLPSALLRTFVKYLGYRLGRYEKQLPTRLKKKLSMYPQFWG